MTTIHQEIGPHFTLDDFYYPPQALLPVAALSLAGDRFLQLRTYWYALSVVAFLIALLLCASVTGAFSGHTTLLMFPAILVAPNVIGTLQIGNIHVLMLACMLLAFACFERKRHLLGGVFLAYAVLTKLWPAVLLAYLVFGRQWRAAVSTLVGLAGLSLITTILYGWQPLADFALVHFPRMVSGEAFAFSRQLLPTVDNLSVLSWWPKLSLLGFVKSDGVDASVLKWAFATFLTALVVLSGFNRAAVPGTALDRLRTWLGLIVIAQLASPFLPGVYGAVPVLCLLWVLLPGAHRAAGILIIVAFAVAAVPIDLFLETNQDDRRQIKPDFFRIWYALAVAWLSLAFALMATVLKLCRYGSFRPE